jgi:hypothetical protein
LEFDQTQVSINKDKLAANLGKKEVKSATMNIVVTYTRDNELRSKR